MKIIKMGETPNPTIRFKCPVCGSVLECNYNEVQAPFNITGIIFDCPVCGLKRQAVTYSAEKSQS